ncbi:MAG: efflux RND transporter periplasmic adaptor subunit [Deltaproteobacteria bacterium]|nr:MAG: efflux RND transporter periplasmic adaptor subunit [Deltaproteobacteria bacterium]
MWAPDRPPVGVLPAALLTLALVLPGAAGAQPVVVARATRVPFPVTVEGLGTARANEAVEIRAQISERVTAIHFDEGQHVEAGAVLVEIDSTRARADVAAARAALVESEAQLRRAAQLREARSLAQAEYDTRLAHRDADRAALAVAESTLADTQVRAPFEGRVGLRRVSVGSLVTPDATITTLDQTDPIKVDFDVPETALAHLATGHPISARSAAWPDEVFTGEVASVDTRVDPVSRTITVRGRLPNPEGRLRPGMFLTVTLRREQTLALVVPEQAIVPEQSRQFVFVVGAGGGVEKREVRTGRRRPSLVEVLSGLEPGERVVAEGTQHARPGGTVEIVDELTIAGDGGAP